MLNGNNFVLNGKAHHVIKYVNNFVATSHFAYAAANVDNYTPTWYIPHKDYWPSKKKIFSISFVANNHKILIMINNYISYNNQGVDRKKY